VRNGRTCGNLSLSRALGDFEFKRNGAQLSKSCWICMPCHRTSVPISFHMSAT